MIKRSRPSIWSMRQIHYLRTCIAHKCFATFEPVQTKRPIRFLRHWSKSRSNRIFFWCLHTFGCGVGVGLASPSSFFMVLPPSLPELSTHQKPGNEAKSCAVVGMAKRFSAAFQRYPTCRASSLRCHTTPLFLEQTDMAMETTVCGLCSVFSDCPK